MNVLKDLRPKKVFEYFEMLSSVPHGSGNTKQISDLCVRFAKDHGLDRYQDELNNVIIYKPASKGYEGKEPVILQGHLDMVCVKTEDNTADLSKEPIKLMTDGEWVWADRTSLGGDNAIAVAMSLAVLDDDSLAHPPIEAVFTTDEETGMYGAEGLDVSKIRGRRMMNIDSEEEGIFTAGCAGGQRANISLKVKRDELNEKCLSLNSFAEICVDGLIGGHSGMEIDKERGNANIIMARLLYDISKRVGIRICEIEGGKFDNAITRKNVAKIAIPKAAYKAFSDEVRRYATLLKKEYETSDPGLSIYVIGCRPSQAPVTREDTVKMLSLVVAMPYGVQNMSMDIKGLVETSLNLGVMKLEGDTFTFGYALRSSVQSRKEALAEKLKIIANSFGAAAAFRGAYPCWTFSKNSPLRDTLMKAYKTVYGGEGVISATHGGLECGLFIEKMPGLDCVSFGPDLRDVHSVREKLNVASVERTYALICETLKNL